MGSGINFSSFLVDRLEALSLKVSRLERELESEKKKSEEFHGLAVVYCLEYQKAKNENESYQCKLAKIKKWQSVFNKIV